MSKELRSDTRRCFLNGLFLRQALIVFSVLSLPNMAFCEALENTSNNLKVVSSIAPVYQIIEEIGEKKLNHHLLVKPNSSEHDYFVKKSDIEALNRADLIFYIDDNLEKNLTKWIKQNEIKNSRRLMNDSHIKILYNLENSNMIDLHIWLNPQNAIAIASFATSELCIKDVVNCNFFQKNLQKFIEKTKNNSKEIKDSFQNHKPAKFAIFHDGYRYFEDYFGVLPELVLLSQNQHQISSKAAKRMAKLSQDREIKCILATNHEGGESAKILAKNFNLKFIELETDKNHVNYRNNQEFQFVEYNESLKNLAKSFQSCF